MTKLMKSASLVLLAWSLAITIGTCSLLQGQAWRTALTVGAAATLWVDYSQITYAHQFGSPTYVFGRELTPVPLTIVNGAELLANTFAPRRVRPWLNAITIVGHIPFLISWSKRPIALVHPYSGRDFVLRIGWKFWPWGVAKQ